MPEAGTKVERQSEIALQWVSHLNMCKYSKKRAAFKEFCQYAVVMIVCDVLTLQLHKDIAKFYINLRAISEIRASVIKIEWVKNRKELYKKQVIFVPIKAVFLLMKIQTS